MCKLVNLLQLLHQLPGSLFSIFTLGFTFLLQEGDKDLFNRVPRARDSPGKDSGILEGQGPFQHHGPDHGQHLGETAGSQCPRESTARAWGCSSSSKVSSHPRAAAESRSLPGCPLTPQARNWGLRHCGGSCPLSWPARCSLKTP